MTSPGAWSAFERARFVEVPIYDAAGWYDVDYAGYRGEDAFYRLLLRAHVRPGQVYVELGAGTGRLCVPYAREGTRVHAVEPAFGMRRRLVEKGRGVAGITVEAARAIDFAGPVEGDVALIGFPFNGVLHIDTRDELVASFTRARRRLIDDGRFALDLTGPSWDAMLRGGLPWGRFDERVHPTTGAKLYTADASRYDAARRRMTIRIRFLEHDADEGVELLLEQTMWTWQEILQALDDAGLVPELMFGDVDLSPFTEKGPRLLVSARARAS